MECVGIIMAIQIPLLIIDRRNGLGHVHVFLNPQVTNLRFDVARVVREMDNGKVRSLFGVSDGIQGITRSSRMVWRIRFI